MSVSEAILSAVDVRIDDEGARGIEQLTVKTTGSNVAVLGAPRALFEVTAGLRDVMHGELLVAGKSPREGLRLATIASAPVDVAIPARWKVRELVRENARLAGHGRREAEARAMTAITSMQLAAYADAKLGGADVSVRRAAVIAAALATGASVIVVEDFTVGLADGAARSLARAFVAACSDPERRWILFAGRLALSSPLGLHAEEALLFTGGRLVAAGPPAEIAARERTFSLRTSGEGGVAFAARLRERGVRVEADDDTARALTVTMPDDFSTRDLIALARDGGVIVLELVPLSGALA